jgi:hypothetical protein
MARYPDPHKRLGSALAALAGGKILESRQIAWASATFSGARHHYVLKIPDGPNVQALPCLDEREFDLPGHIVADIVLADHIQQAGACRISIDALTVEDC